jgi:hypothetical protein
VANFRNVSDETRLVGVGVRRQFVEPDSVIEVPDDLFENYDQPGIWEPVQDTAPKTERLGSERPDIEETEQ